MNFVALRVLQIEGAKFFLKELKLSCMMKRLNEYFGTMDGESKKHSPHCSFLQCRECL